MDTHKFEVREIAKRVRDFHRAKKPFRMYHGSSYNTHSSGYNSRTMIDITHLRHILAINTMRNCAVVEPNVSMGQLVKETLKYRLIPIVVPSFRSITVGGAFSGIAAESSSYKSGYFSQSVTRVEVVLGNGDRVKVSCEEHQELFSGLAGGLGTFGIVTLLEVSLMPAMERIEITYSLIPDSGGRDETIAACQKAIGNPKYEFVDGMIFKPPSPIYAVIVQGRMTDESPRKTSPRKDSWFYLHAATRPIETWNSPTYTEILPIADYLFRYDCGAYWLGKLALGIFPCNSVTKKLISPWLRADRIVTALHKAGHTQHLIIQDAVLPIENADKFIHYLEDRVQIYPLWLCPVRVNSISIMQQHPQSADILINIGIRGCPDDTLMEYDRFKTMSQHIESRIGELGGLKWLYPPVFCTEEEFWKIHDLGKYNELREKNHAGLLLNVYEKVRARGKIRKSNWTT
ncbi:FAD-binding domain-containing protein [Lophium mytilinum]|uniref:Delta(24)-sterol reductase n=1 Tax=Lophium mytilinum TaxID=390894 RepID=A0A6A6R6X9_9PEZI|nr:FAD-binding domain-containing protein [Lophium mytilinum]